MRAKQPCRHPCQRRRARRSSRDQRFPAAHTRAGSWQNVRPGGPCAGAGAEREEEGAAETKRDPSPVPHRPALLVQVGKSSVKLSLGRTGGWGEGGFSFGFVSCHPTLSLIGKKLIFPSSSLLPISVIGVWSPCPCLNS